MKNASKAQAHLGKVLKITGQVSFHRLTNRLHHFSKPVCGTSSSSLLLLTTMIVVIVMKTKHEFDNVDVVGYKSKMLTLMIGSMAAIEKMIMMITMMPMMLMMLTRLMMLMMPG